MVSPCTYEDSKLYLPDSVGGVSIDILVAEKDWEDADDKGDGVDWEEIDWEDDDEDDEDNDPWELEDDEDPWDDDEDDEDDEDDNDPWADED